MFLQAAIGVLAAAWAVENPAETVATVNGAAVTRAELDGAFRQTRISDRADQLAPGELHKLKVRVLQTVVNRKLLEQRLAELKVPVDEAQVGQHVQQIEEKLGKQGQTLPDLLRRLGVNEEQMRADIRHDFRWVNYVSSQAKESVLRKYFEANRPAFEGVLAKCRHLLIAAPEGSTDDQKRLARNRSADLRARVAAGEPFEKLARERSDCPSKERGGLLEDFPRKGAMSEPFAAAAFALKPGELSDVVETEFGCHLILMVEKKPATRAVKYEDVADDVKSAYAEDLRRATVMDLRRRGDVKLLLAPPPAAAAAAGAVRR